MKITVLAVAAALLLASIPASAQPRHVREAERRAAEALNAAAALDFDRAADLFLEAHSLSPDPEYVLQAARALQRNRHAAEALTLYQAYLSMERNSAYVREIERAQRTLEPLARKTHGQVRFHSTPPGAVVMDDRTGRRLGVTPMSAWLTHGFHRVRVAIPGHPAQVHRIDVEGERIATVHTIGRKGERRKSKGKGILRIDGKLDGLSVRIDGQTVLTGTGTRAWRVTSGRRAIEIRRGDDIVLRQTVTVASGGSVVIAIPTKEQRPRKN